MDMLTDSQTYCLMSTIHLFLLLLASESICRKMAEGKLYYLYYGVPHDFGATLC